ncbi:MAG: malto-oligosyltrehalose trehalohydrolase [Gemmataceae bacterium]
MIDPYVPGALWSPPHHCQFVVWAPQAELVLLHLLPSTTVPMQRTEAGYHQVQLDGIHPGQRYQFELPGGIRRPDPASRKQPEGVHGPSEVVNPTFDWHDQSWIGLPLRDLVLYELHVGTFTPPGTFDGVIDQLGRLHDLGITGLNLMPVAQFPGTRNWGYDGVQPYCVQDSYGGTDGLKRLVDAAHARNLAVLLDVVYNHLGPEGNYLRDFGPYFTDRYRIPWGEAINFDGPDSDRVRHFFLMNALRWQREFHLDGLRLDAVHAILDFSAIPFLAELADQAQREANRLGRPFHLIAESDLNNARLVRPTAEHGLGMDAFWSDDFHHAVHARLTGERQGYYEDFGAVSDLVRVFRDGMVYTGQYSPHRRRKHGNPAQGLRPEQLVVCVQNHDQVGNRAFGERLGSLVSPPGQRLAAALLLLSPFTPLLFMGEEHGETRPFLYFTSHGDPALAEAVRTGRRAEFAQFNWPGEIPDPQAESTFEQSRLDPSGGDPSLYDLYRSLIALRRSLPLRGQREVEGQGDSLRVHYQQDCDEVCMVFQLGSERATTEWSWPAGRWRGLLTSHEEIPTELLSSGHLRLELPGLSFAVFRREE